MGLMSEPFCLDVLVLCMVGPFLLILKHNSLQHSGRTLEHKFFISWTQLFELVSC